MAGHLPASQVLVRVSGIIPEGLNNSTSTMISPITDSRMFGLPKNSGKPRKKDSSHIRQSDSGKNGKTRIRQ